MTPKAISLRLLAFSISSLNASKLLRGATTTQPARLRESGALGVAAARRLRSFTNLKYWDGHLPPSLGGRVASAMGGGPTRKTRGRLAKGDPSHDVARTHTAPARLRLPLAPAVGPYPVTATPWLPCGHP
jgi:hypothetical protein